MGPLALIVIVAALVLIGAVLVPTRAAIENKRIYVEQLIENELRGYGGHDADLSRAQKELAALQRRRRYGRPMLAACAVICAAFAFKSTR